MKTTVIIIMTLLIGMSLTAIWGAEPVDIENNGVYSDIPRTHWASDAIMYLIEENILDRETPGYVSPVTRMLERIKNDENSKMRFIEMLREIYQNDDDLMKKTLEMLDIEYQPEPQDTEEEE